MRFLNDRVKRFWFIGFMWINNYCWLMKKQLNWIIKWFTQEFMIHMKWARFYDRNIMVAALSLLTFWNSLIHFCIRSFVHSIKSWSRILWQKIKCKCSRKKVCPQTTELIKGNPKTVTHEENFLFFSILFKAHKHMSTWQWGWCFVYHHFWVCVLHSKKTYTRNDIHYTIFFRCMCFHKTKSSNTLECHGPIACTTYCKD